MSQNSEAYQYLYSVSFTGNTKAYTFGSNTNTYLMDDAVVVETARGIELGYITSEVKPFDDAKVVTELKPIIRKASEHDTSQYERNQKDALVALQTCADMIRDFNLDMKLISAEYTLDRSKIIFIYVADERVDFRELVRELASNLHTRIELRQIGPRDKAKMIGGIGQCGLETCCSKFLDGFDVISINMAKNQLLALNIPKLSGQCGKLMCCLKYENDDYKELRKGCPKLNSQITYNGSRFRVSGLNVLSRQAKLDNRLEVHYLPFEEAFKDVNKETQDSDETSKKLSK